jgi:hypothetical protein
VIALNDDDGRIGDLQNKVNDGLMRLLMYVT